MAQTATVSSKERVVELLGNPLYDEKYALKYPKNRQWIVGSHGTHLGQVVSLARNGWFSGGTAGLEGEFYLTANVGYKSWDKASFGNQITDPAYKDTDFVRQGINYAESADREEFFEEIDRLKSGSDDGVVFMFGKRVLEMTDISVNCSDDEDNAPELILPKAPTLDVITGIYPLNQMVRQNIDAVLKNV